MRIQISQNNYLVGDLDANFAIIKKEYFNACTNDSDLIVFSELAIVGYPPQDLLRKDYFLKEVKEKIDQIVRLTTANNCAILLGTPIVKNSLIYNGALFIKNGEVRRQLFKKELPNYKLFDEKRYFAASEVIDYLDLKGTKISVLICEDVWNFENIRQIKSHDSDLMVVLNASPFSADKIQQRYEVCSEFCRQVNLPLIYVNQVGGVDSMVFDGKSFVMDKRGRLSCKLAAFASDSRSIDFDIKMEILPQQKRILQDDLMADLYSAVTLALRDYVRKTGFEKVVIGMSGGIDSALVAVIACDALASENVRLVALPTRFNSRKSFDDATNCAKNLDLFLEVIPVEGVVNRTLEALQPNFDGTSTDVTEENLQSRVRGVILMALSNKFNELLITTGNKSEMATGYATIYGDMNGAFNPIKDLYKTQIFSLAKWRNDNIPDLSDYRRKNLIPTSIIDKEPSAELSAGQKDSDSLPSYEILDKILYKMIEEEKSVVQTIEETGFEESLVKKIAKLFYQNEYKRKQAVIGPKVSKMAFDLDRRYLITNQYWK